MKSFIPKDFNLIAKTEMPGTGGTIVRAYANVERKIYFTIEYRNKDNEIQISAFGPVEQRLLGIYLCKCFCGQKIVNGQLRKNKLTNRRNSKNAIESKER